MTDGSTEGAGAVAPQFDAYYYSHDCGRPYERDEHWRTFFGGVADGIVREVAPATVLDVGCAMGFLVEALRERGVEAWGIDVSEYAIGKVHESVSDYCAVSSATADLPPGFPTHFDLVTCVEVIEHLPAEAADSVVANLSRWGQRVLFSSSADDYAEATHLNVQPAEEWAALFARHGMIRDFDADASFLTPWAVLFDHSLTNLPYAVKRYERRMARVRRENLDLRAGVIRMQQALTGADQARERAEAELATDRAVSHAEVERAKQAVRDEADRAEAAMAQLEQRQLELRGIEDRAAALERDRAAIVSERDSLQAVLQSVSAELEETRARVAALRRDYDALASQASGAASAEQATRMHLGELERQRDDYRVQLEAMQRSRVWRVGRVLSAPLRIGRA